MAGGGDVLPGGTGVVVGGDSGGCSKEGGNGKHCVLGEGVCGCGFFVWCYVVGLWWLWWCRVQVRDYDYVVREVW